MKNKILFLATMMALMAGCSSDPESNGNFATTKNAIMYGTSDTAKAHNAVVMLAANNSFFCSGTLIHPDYVLTAGHCVDGLTSSDKKSFVVGIGNTESAALQKSYSVATIYKHEKYTEKSDGSCYNDIALLKLAKSVPSSVAEPILPLPPEYAVTQAEINKTGSPTVFSGFGQTERGTYGTKLKMSMNIKGYCGAFNTPKDSTSGCYMGKYELSYGGGWWGGYTTTEEIYTDYGTIFYEQEVGGPCSGDSGGPAFITRNGKEYVLGVTSYGDETCDIYGVSTSVPDFYDWLKTKAPAVFTDLKYENCTDGKDNDGDGKADCADTDCSFHASCDGVAVEICTDGKDNDKDGLVDCKDPDCTTDDACKPRCGDGIVNNSEECDGKVFANNKTTCVAWDSSKYASGSVSCSSGCTVNYSACKLKPTKEICNDGIDNDQDGLLDCKDPDCTLDPACTENCTDGLDNDGDGLIDCDDGYCADAPACTFNPGIITEICNNHVDDDGDTLVDCNDMDCMYDAVCLTPEPPAAEICDDGIDNDKDGFIDCFDMDCIYDAVCLNPTPAAEVCDDGYDNDGDGFIDCFDSDCASNSVCLVSAEICNDGIDNDKDGLADCFDSDCKYDSACFVPEPVVAENCTNGIDDDGDGYADCKDYDCRLDAACVESVVISVENCSNQFDDDFNGLMDCNDPACLSAAECAHKVEICGNGLDDDEDGLADCNDPDCKKDSSCIGKVEICGNGLDDDNNGLKDCEDPTCFSVCNGNASEGNRPVVTEICNDSIDNDGDQLIDCLDPDCASFAACAASTGGEICDNNLDDDGDFLADCSDPDCVNALNCRKVEICDNGIDDNGNGLIDQNDPDCIHNISAKTMDNCSAMPKIPTSAPILPMLFGLLGLGTLIRRRRG